MTSESFNPKANQCFSVDSTHCFGFRGKKAPSYHNFLGKHSAMKKVVPFSCVSESSAPIQFSAIFVIHKFKTLSVNDMLLTSERCTIYMGTQGGSTSFLLKVSTYFPKLSRAETVGLFFSLHRMFYCLARGSVTTW